ncbi:class I SAM-dependent methyltransferase [Chloroflexota bacterium]
MWVGLISGIAIILLVILILGCRRVNIIRHVSPDEGIEDVELIKAYDRISQRPPFRLLRKLIIMELKKHNPQGILADVGCGPGYLITDMRKTFKELSITGVDISDEILQQASKNIAALGYEEKTSFRRGDIHALPFEANSLDFIVSTLSLHHWSEPIKALHEIHRVLKPEGQFLLFDLRRDSPRLFYWLTRFVRMFIVPAIMRRINEPTSSVLANYTPIELDSILKMTPFKKWNIKRGVFYLFAFGEKSGIPTD